MVAALEIENFLSQPFFNRLFHSFTFLGCLISTLKVRQPNLLRHQQLNLRHKLIILGLDPYNIHLNSNLCVKTKVILSLLISYWHIQTQTVW